MGEYGSGLTMARCFAMDKERIKKALEGKIAVGEDENGFVYEDCTKEVADRYILSTFDNAVYHARRLAASGRATEAYLDSKGIKINFMEWRSFRDAEASKDYQSTDYEYEKPSF